MHWPSAAMAPSGMRDASEAYTWGRANEASLLLCYQSWGCLWCSPTSCLEGLVELEMGALLSIVSRCAVASFAFALRATVQTQQAGNTCPVMAWF